MRLMKDIVRPLVYFLPDHIHRQRRNAALKSSLPPVSKTQLADQLLKLEIPPRSVVLVHSSLKAFGYVEGGPAAVVDALVDAFVTRNRGTVMLPTFSIKGTMHGALSSGEVFDVVSTPSNLGAIPETFRRHPQARRSLHPTHSFAAIGPDADRLVESHHTCGTSFGADSPMARMLEFPSYILGLGTNLGTVTFYHCLEEIESGFPIDVFTADSPVSAECRGYDGKVYRLSLNAHDSSIARTRIDRLENSEIRDFFTRRLERNAGLSWHRVGEARSWLVEAAAFYDEIRGLMLRGMTIYSRPSQIEAFERNDETAVRC